MDTDLVDVTLHIDEELTHTDRETLRDKILAYHGVAAADYHDNKPHLMVVEYNPHETKSAEFVKLAKEQGYHVELIGL